MPKPLSRKKYDKQLKAWQARLQAVQVAFRREGARGVVVFEGWDAAGKGGAIRRMAWVLDPRGFDVHPIAAPLPQDRGRHYLRRFWLRLPGPGELAVFDRSWYGRVLVERVEGLVTKAEWRRAYGEINQFEQQLVDDDFRIVKLFLHITPEEQLDRFRARFRHPLKRWKLTPEDLRNRARWKDYQDAIEDMLAETSTKQAPWHVVPANCKHFARVRALELIVEGLGRGLDLGLPSPHPEVAAMASEVLGIDPDEIAPCRPAGR